MIGSEEIQRRLTYVPPSPSAVKRHDVVRSGALGLAGIIDEHCPDSREKSLALTALQEALMWANAAIATNLEGQI